MKRYLMIAIIVSVIAVAGSYMAFGQQRSGMMGGGMMRGGMMNRGDQQQGMMGNDDGMMGNNRGMMPMAGMPAMMAQSMMHEGLVATTDGGIVVWAGGKLMKYDSGLNLVREIELQVDYSAMQKKMQKMMENMPMDSQMMQRRGGMMGSSNQDSSGSSTSR
jgi:hypothetical protein